MKNTLSILVLGAASICLVACPSSKDRSASTPVPSGLSAEALEFAKRYFAKHASQCGDSWYSRCQLADYFRTIQNVEVSIYVAEVQPLTESDRLNGVEWQGSIGFSAKRSRDRLEAMGRASWDPWREMGHGLPQLVLVKMKNSEWKVIGGAEMGDDCKPVPCDAIPQ